VNKEALVRLDVLSRIDVRVFCDFVEDGFEDGFERRPPGMPLFV
jgi:hypothetical protein